MRPYLGRHLVSYAARTAACAILAVLIGCGGGSGGTNMVSRQNEGTFSEDAKRLAARSATGPWISADLAKAYQADLDTIRAKYTTLAGIHAGVGFSLTDVLVSVKSTASFGAAWKNGTVTTGVSSIDNLLAQYNPVSVSQLADYSDHQVYLLRFAQSLNITALLAPIKASSPDITQVNYNNYAGDGDDIKVQQASIPKIYVFSHGWGDCASGCVSHHYWTVTLSANGTLSLTESGTLLT